MSSQVEITVPSTSVSPDTKPYTIYNISLRLPLRSFTVQKRFSDFLDLHRSLTDVVGAVPPAKPPSKTWFANSVSKPELANERRIQLERYLQTINSTEDSRWRATSIWRMFLDLPPVSSQRSAKAGALHSVISGSAPISDPVIWLDIHRDLKAQLHDARLNLTSRDQATTPQKQHEASAAAKSALVKAGTMITSLEDGLANIQNVAGFDRANQKLGEGELRRRKDLIAASKKDRDGLENLLQAMTQKAKLDSAVASVQDKKDLIGLSKPRTGRVLGKETDETRELDNTGLVQLQKQKMADQDVDIDELRKIVMRQREMGQQINQELEYQNALLTKVDEDADRVQGKINVAKKRTDKIS